MYRAKQAGRDTFRFFTAQMNTEVLARLELETALRKAVENDEFVLHYQPKVQLSNGRIAGLEALLRWQRPGHGLVSPKDFMPLLEETGLILRVGSGSSRRRESRSPMDAPSIEPVRVSVTSQDASSSRGPGRTQQGAWRTSRGRAPRAGAHGELPHGNTSAP